MPGASVHVRGGLSLSASGDEMKLDGIIRLSRSRGLSDDDDKSGNWAVSELISI